LNKNIYYFFLHISYIVCNAEFKYVFLLQGHDTVAMGLTYAILLLAEHKDAQVLAIIYLIYKHNQLIN